MVDEIAGTAETELDRRFAAMMDAWDGAPPIEERCLFLALPPDKQEMALRRLPAVRAFLAGRPVTRGEVESSLDVSRPFFYKIASSFASSGSIGSLVPWSPVAVPRGRSNDENARIRWIIEKAVCGVMPFGPEELAASFRRDLGAEAPAAATAKAMAAAAVPRVLNGFRLLPRWASLDIGHRSNAFGDVLLLEQVQIERSATRYLSFVMDARTRFVCGFEDGGKGPDALLQALLDAAANGADGRLPISTLRGRPSVRGSMGRGPGWERLESVISRGFDGVYRRADAFRNGTFVTRLLGGRIAWVDLSLLSRRRAERWSRAEIACAVRAHNLSRLIRHPELGDPYAARTPVQIAKTIRGDPLVFALAESARAALSTGAAGEIGHDNCARRR